MIVPVESRDTRHTHLNRGLRRIPFPRWLVGRWGESTIDASLLCIAVHAPINSAWTLIIVCISINPDYMTPDRLMASTYCCILLLGRWASILYSGTVSLCQNVSEYR